MESCSTEDQPRYKAWFMMSVDEDDNVSVDFNWANEEDKKTLALLLSSARCRDVLLMSLQDALIDAEDDKAQIDISDVINSTIEYMDIANKAEDTDFVSPLLNEVKNENRMD